jgi:nitroreductase
MLKLVLRKYFPFIYLKIKYIIAYHLLRKGYAYDIKRYFNQSDYYYHESEKACISRIIHRYHPVEKGLTMPEMRLGFGQENILELINDCGEYSLKYLDEQRLLGSDNYIQYLHALSVLNEYLTIHRAMQFEVDVNISRGVELLTQSESRIDTSGQVEMTRDEFFNDADFSFTSFALSRHSLRNFKGKVSIDDIISAIDVAQGSPSACNRQPTRVHIVDNIDLIKNILNLQGGNRGFGHLVDKLLIISAELGGYRSIGERNNLFVDGGLYAMSLLYALHSYRVGACSLNWCATPDQDEKLRDILPIPETQTVVMMIACGGVPESFKLASSKRYSSSHIIHTHS